MYTSRKEAREAVVTSPHGTHVVIGSEGDPWSIVHSRLMDVLKLSRNEAVRQSFRALMWVLFLSVWSSHRLRAWVHHVECRTTSQLRFTPSTPCHPYPHQAVGPRQ